MLDINLSHHPTKCPFTGTLDVAGFHVGLNSLERHFSESRLKFTGTLPGTWFAEIRSSPTDGLPISVAVRTEGVKLPSGRRSRIQHITSVSLGFDHDPWDKTHVPRPIKIGE